MNKILFIAAITAIAVLAGCKAKDKPIPVTDVTMSQTSKTMEIGDTLLLTATVAPYNATNKNITWTSSVPSVASVLNGKVTALTAGTTTIIATSVDGGKIATCTFVVNPTKTVSVGKQTGVITAGEAGTATFSVTTENIANGSYDVTVANRPSGVTVQGKVAISEGSGTLTLSGNTTTTAGTTSTLALTLDGATSKPFELTIMPAFVPVTEITNRVTTAKAGVPTLLTGTVVPSNATNQTIVFRIVGMQTATYGSTITNNVLTGVGEGLITVEARIEGGVAPDWSFIINYHVTITK
jgi:hypothetical protein